MLKLMPQSPSSVNTYNTCPKQYQAKYITKEIKFEPNPATERGTRWHSYLEERVANEKALPSEVAHFEPLIDRLMKFNGEVKTEFNLAINDKFEPCDYRDRYIGGNIDLGIIDHENCKALLFDYKTGKVKDSEDFQFQLLTYALMTLKAYPHIQQVRVAYLFLDHCKISPRGSDGKLGVKYTRKDLADMENEVFQNIERIRRSTERNEWLPNPSGLCKPMAKNGNKPYCQVKSCPFWGKR